MNCLSARFDIPPRPLRRPRLETLPDSAMVDKIIRKFANRRTFVSEGCEYARAAVQDGVTNQAVVAWSSLGNWGRQAQNHERDLHAWLGPQGHGN
eukprot:2974418-Pyramimonas_sp.AAC.1